MESKSNEIFYGCYNGGYEKMYRWQCKAFTDKKDADEFAIQNAQKSEFKSSILVSFDSYIPNFMHRFLIKSQLSSQYSQVKIINK